jgi:2-oxoglutarate dehydrogenase E2 component (dihydrolipoamide succinyltransferase)
MALEIRLPPLGESISEATIVRWLKEPGDRIARDEDFAVVSTDKVETVLPSPSAGVLLHRLFEVGETPSVGALIAVVGDAGEKWTPPPAAVKPAAPAPSALRSARRGASSQAPDAGQRRGRPRTGSGGAAQPGNSAFRATLDPKLFVSPVVRRLAREHDVDLGLIAGTGRGGRISRRDIEGFISGGGGGTGFVAPEGGYTVGIRMPFGGFARRLAIPFDPETADRFAAQLGDGDRIEELSGMGRAMANHMAYTWWRAPHVSTLVEIDMSAVTKARRERRFSYTVYIAHALARVLPKHPGFNSSLTDDFQRIVHGGINLGIAVAKPDGGLVVPVLRDVGNMSLADVDSALRLQVERARAGTLRSEDLRGGTFTITNVGSNGNLASMPLINQPQVAIIAIGAIKKRVVVVPDAAGNDEMVIRPMMYLTLTYDHRANDGAGSGRFLKELRKRIELMPGQE